MSGNKNHDFAMERRLRELNPELHRRFTNAVIALQYNLSHYKRLFPEFTDHTILHSMSVADFSNQLIGERLHRLNADELYALLMGCYLHDAGMGITRKDYLEFSEKIDFGSYFDEHSRENYPAIIRSFHHEFSGLFIRKYAPLFDFPSEAHCWAVIQIARGHRRTDLMDEREYPASFSLPDGDAICLPYLAALIRLADEIDVTTDRNPILLYDIGALTIEEEIRWYKVTRAVRSMEISKRAFTLHVDASDPEILEAVRVNTAKMGQALDVCRSVVCQRTPYEITQNQVLICEEL